MNKLRAAAEAAADTLFQLHGTVTKDGWVIDVTKEIDAIRAALAEQEDTRVCTCHPDDNPPQPCPRQYALDECRRVALAEPEVEQEPVAWMTRESEYRLRHGGNSKGAVPVHKESSTASRIPLYTHPPRREWVGLTDEELFAAYLSAPPALDRHLDGFRAIEQALKEKNT